MTTPGDEYRRRLAARRDTHAALARVDARFGYARLLVFGIGVVGAVAAMRGWLSPWWLAPAIAAFGGLVVRHDRVIRASQAAARAIAFYDRGLARLEDRWAGTGETGDRFLAGSHLYAHDLDLFGRGSLFELLSTARTSAGEEALARWLLAPAGVDTIHARQRAVVELAPRLDMREALSLAGSDVRVGVHPDAVVAWAESPILLGASWMRPAALALSLAAVATAGAWATTGAPAPFLAVVVLELLLSLLLRQRLARTLHGADSVARDLDVLAVVLARLEADTFAATRLVTLQQTLRAGGTVGASASIRRLHRLVELHDWQHNAVFAPLAAAVLWGTHVALAVDAWRAVHGRHVREWLQVAGEFEAVASLAAYHFEHPDDPFPDVIPATTPRGVFDGDGLGHPLIPTARLVRNAVSLSGPTQALVVSGSNMSGKSTLLRTVGINAVLALAGAPVRATHLRLTPLALGATLRIQDSLQEGRSRFYAEISRLRDVADLTAGGVPVLFLFDELLHGTNSHDRVAGASGVLRALLDRDAIGLVTTHDLAMTALVADLTPRAANVHFDDRFEDGELHFDFVMKPGPVRRSNAIALMRAVGLSVPPEHESDPGLS